MGRATVIGGGEDGFYSIEIDVGQERLDNRLDALTDEKVALEAQIVAGEAEVAAWIVAIEPIQAGVSTRIDAYIAAVAAKSGVDAAFASLKEQLGYLYTAYRWKGDAERRLAALKLQLAAVKKARAALLNVDTTRQMDVWCADLTEDATGEVATIEIPGEPQAVLIAPGNPVGSRASIVPTAQDGQLLTRPAMTGPQAYFNAAVLPGWQKWMPDYRSGVISNIDTEADTATVTLASANSTAQNLDVNQTTVLTNVPIEYMECNSFAFEDGDEVVVQFVDRDWALPKVIGFLNNPQPCYRLAWFFGVGGNIGSYYEADVEPTGEDWTAWSDYPFLSDPSFVDAGHLIPRRGCEFWEVSGAKLPFKELKAKIVMYGLATRDKEAWLEIGPQKTFDGAATGCHVNILIGDGTLGSRFMVTDGWPDADDYLPGDTSFKQWFTFAEWTSPEPVTVNLHAVIGLTSQQLYLNGTLAAELTQTFTEAWRQLGRIWVLSLNDASTPAELLYLTDRWDFIGVR